MLKGLDGVLDSGEGAPQVFGGLSQRVGMPRAWRWASRKQRDAHGVKPLSKPLQELIDALQVHRQPALLPCALDRTAVRESLQYSSQHSGAHAVPRQEASENDPHGSPTATSLATVGAPNSLPPHCLLVRRIKIVTLYMVVAIECAGSSAMGTAGLFQGPQHLIAFLLVAYKSNYFHGRGRMNASRNDPCPCGSGKKYKKCCLAQDQKSAADARRRRQADEEERQLAEAAEHDEFMKHAAALEKLSNHANDLTRSGQWAEAESCCRELLQRFPEEIDGHHRSYECYKAKGDLVLAKVHAEATLLMVESREGFDPGFPARLKKDIARFEHAIQKEQSSN